MWWICRTDVKQLLLTAVGTYDGRTHPDPRIVLSEYAGYMGGLSRQSERVGKRYSSL